MTISPTCSRSELRSEHLVVLGVSTSGAIGSSRRELAIGPEHVVDVRSRILGSHPHLEQVVVATCDRTEVVLGSPAGVDPRAAIELWHRSLGIHVEGGPAPCLAPAARPFVHLGRDAAEHILRVACGLESSLLGDADVLGQLRRAWRDADSAGVAGPITRAIFRDAFAAGRRARSTTDIGVGGAGVGSAVAAAATGAAGPILVIGAGPAGRTIARRLAKTTSSPITIANRTARAAEQLAAEIGGRSINLDRLDDALLDAGLVVSAVAAPQPILTSRRLSMLREIRPDWAPMIIDVGAPANVEATPGVDVVGLDGLVERSAATSQRRVAAVPDVERIISAVLDRREADRTRPRFSTHAVARHDSGAVPAVAPRRNPLP